MLTLSSFPSPPSHSLQTICEKNSCLITQSAGEEDVTKDLPFPAFFGSTEKCKLIKHRETRDQPFLLTNEPLRVQLLRAWNQRGIIGVVAELLSSNKSESNTNKRTFLNFFSSIFNLFSKLHKPQLLTSTSEVYNTSQDRDAIRYFAWHPHINKLAVALRDDELLIKEFDSSAGTRALRLASQKQIVMLAWRPFLASDLAVACSSCIIIWHVQPSSLAGNSRSDITTTNQILSKAGHNRISSIAWTPAGDLLASCSSVDCHILLWNTNMEECQAVRSTSGLCLGLASFTHDNLKLITTCTTNSFLIWECKNWKSEEWGGMDGCCSSFAWSPDSKMLLFTPSNQPTIYSMAFGKSSAELLVTQLPKAVVSLAEVDVGVGGLVHQMAWDPHGERLAVSFKGQSSALIAVFQTRYKPDFKAFPRGYVRGFSTEKVSMISFKPTFPSGSLLSVAWTSGRVSHVPFYYTPGLMNTQQLGKKLHLSEGLPMDQLMSFSANLSLNSVDGFSGNNSFSSQNRSFDLSSKRDQSTGIWF